MRNRRPKLTRLGGWCLPKRVNSKRRQRVSIAASAIRVTCSAVPGRWEFAHLRPGRRGHRGLEPSGSLNLPLDGGERSCLYSWPAPLGLVHLLCECW
jgi:hypothetical protein